MPDLSPRWIYIKAALFLLIGVLACVGILIELPTWRVALLLALAIWAFARAYYFAFYVIQHYIDPTYHFAGLFHVLRYLLGRPRR